jgi:heptosyltransferase II
MKLAVFLPNWVGDAVMATPALRALRTEYRRAEIVGVMRPVIADVLEGTGIIDRALLYHPRGRDGSQRGSVFLRALQAEKCHGAILFTNSLRTAWLAWRSGATERIGFARDLRGLLLTTRLTPKSKTVPNPVIDEYNRIAEAAGCRRITRTMELAVTERDRTALESFWAKHRGVNRERVIVFNTGGAFGPAKNWPIASFTELAQRLVKQTDFTVLVACGPGEQTDARAIVAGANSSRVVTFADEPLSIGLTKAAVQSAGLMVTTDSGPRHFASAFGVPVITLFGPTHIAWSETYSPHAVHLQHPVDCGPCQQRTCPLKHHRCMTELSVDRVFQAVMSRLNQTQKRVA